MRLYNPSDEKVEFLIGGVRYIMDARESREFPNEVAKHALTRSRVGLVEYHPAYDNKMLKTDMDYTTLPWRKLVTLASTRKIFVPGMVRADLEKAMIDYDTQRGIVQKSSDKKEGEGS